MASTESPSPSTNRAKSPTGTPPYYVGVDLGGTKIMVGVFDSTLRSIGRDKIGTKSHRGTEAVIQRIAKCVREEVEDCKINLKDVRAVGVGAPSAVNEATGEVLFAPNLQWRNVPLKQELESLLERPVYVANDCNMATLGIHQVEFKGKYGDLIGIFLGTGIGGGLVLNGKIYSGFDSAAGELGHMVILAGGPTCSCGNQGCFEALAGRASLYRQIQAAVDKGEKTILTEIQAGQLTNLRSRSLRKALQENDKLATKIIRKASKYTGIAVANLINIFSPEIIVLGGGMIEALEQQMMPEIEASARQHILTGTNSSVRILATQLGDHAGITGGAVLARERSVESATER